MPRTFILARPASEAPPQFAEIGEAAVADLRYGARPVNRPRLRQIPETPQKLASTVTISVLEDV